MNFPPILVLVIIWLLAGLVSSGKKKAQQQAARNAKNGPAKPGAKTPQAESPKPAAQPQAAPFRPTVLQPSITVTEHDDSVYQGSLNADTGEGCDPCHDEQLSPLSAAEREPLAAAEEAPGFRLGWSGDEIVRGFVMSEILTRKKRKVS